jgi:hypothetical protein
MTVFWIGRTFSAIEKPARRQCALAAGVSNMFASTIRPRATLRKFRAHGASILPALALLLCASLLAALEPPSKPFLDKNSFYLTSAGSSRTSPTTPPAERRYTRCRRTAS